MAAHTVTEDIETDTEKSYFKDVHDTCSDVINKNGNQELVFELRHIHSNITEESISGYINDDGENEEKNGAEFEDAESHHQLLYNVNDIPPIGIMVSVAVQNILLGLGGALTTAYVISDVICAGPNHPIRAKLFCTTLFMNGICTLLQPIIGVRLAIYQGVCSTFLVPLMGMRSNKQWQCDRSSLQIGVTVDASNTTADMNGTTEIFPNTEEEMYRKLREMMGSLMLASLAEVLAGATGLVGVLLRFIGPLTISTVVSLIGLSLYKIPMEYVRTHWGMSSLCIISIVICMLYMNKIRIPLPVRCSTKNGAQRIMRIPVFEMFPLIFGVLVTWLVCGILTITGVFTDDPSALEYRARTDVRDGIVHATPWLYFPYPGQFGSPLFNTTIFVGFLSAVISSILESIGDYYAAANISLTPPLPKHAVNRGILLEGLGSVLSGAMAAGHATTSSTPNVALIGISKVASRSCLAAAGVICLVLSIIGKLGAILSTMPDPAIGGAMFVAFGILGSIGIFTLKAVDLSSSRNLAIFGLSLYAGIVVPEWMEKYPDYIDTGSETGNGIIKGILGTPMFLGGFVAALLDNTVKGTLKERGFLFDDIFSKNRTYTLSESETYDIPYVNAVLEKIPWLQRLPFIQPLHKS